MSNKKLHLPALIIGISIMLIGSIFPFVFADAEGKADHGIATALIWAMIAGIVRGVGFIPRNVIARWLLSQWACVAGIAIAFVLRFV